MKKIIIISCSILLAILLYILSQYLFFGKATLEVKSQKENVSFIMNDQVIKAPTLIKNLNPGEYTITCHVEGYKTFQTKITLKRMRKSSVELKFEEYPTTEEGIDDASKSILKGIEGEGAKASGEIKNREKNYPLTKYMPYVTYNFVFDFDDDNGFVTYYAMIYNSYDPNTALADIRSWIKGKGIDPDTIKIQIKH